jgi:hypothetical protein
MDFSPLLEVKLVLSFCFFEGSAVVFLAISCEYNLQEPTVRKIDNKTILNKFVFKGFNAIFVKYGLFFDVSNLHINFWQK